MEMGGKSVTSDPCELCRMAQCPKVCYAQRDYAKHHGRTRFTRKNDKTNKTAMLELRECFPAWRGR